MRNFLVLVVIFLVGLAVSAGETRYYRQTPDKKQFKELVPEDVRASDLSTPAAFKAFCTNFGVDFTNKNPKANVIILNDLGESCWQSSFFVTGNETYVVVLSTLPGYSWTEPAFDTCGTRPTVLPINGAGASGGKSNPSAAGGGSSSGPSAFAEAFANMRATLSPSDEQRAAEEWKAISDTWKSFTNAQKHIEGFRLYSDANAPKPPAGTYLTAFVSADSHKCWASTISFQVVGYTGSDLTDKNKLIPVSRKVDQYTRYLAGLQIGVIASKNHDQTFGLTLPDKTIYAKGATGTTQQFIASIVFYGASHYLGRNGRYYEGRDIVNEKRFRDKLGLSVGTSVSDPTRRGVLGLSYEIGSGIDLFLGGEYVRVNALNGVKVHDAFSGSASDIPIHDIGKTGFVFGLTLDATYVSGLFHK